MQSGVFPIVLRRLGCSCFVGSLSGSILTAGVFVFALREDGTVGFGCFGGAGAVAGTSLCTFRSAAAVSFGVRPPSEVGCCTTAF